MYTPSFCTLCIHRIFFLTIFQLLTHFSDCCHGLAAACFKKGSLKCMDSSGWEVMNLEAGILIGILCGQWQVGGGGRIFGSWVCVKGSEIGC